MCCTGLGGLGRPLGCGGGLGRFLASWRHALALSEDVMGMGDEWGLVRGWSGVRGTCIGQQL